MEIRANSSFSSGFSLSRAWSIIYSASKSYPTMAMSCLKSEKNFAAEEVWTSLARERFAEARASGSP